MTWEAIDTILDKAWECNAHACIETDSKMIINKDEYDWQTYSTLNVLCILNKKENKEYYFNVDDIHKITIIFDEPR